MDSEDEDRQEVNDDVPTIDQEGQAVVEREIVEHEGWQDLVWSFAVSGTLTVRIGMLLLIRNRFLTLRSCLHIFSPSFLHSPCSGII